MWILRLPMQNEEAPGDKEVTEDAIRTVQPTEMQWMYEAMRVIWEQNEDAR